ncbi:MAG TPA: response regulator [Gammaproteobacteria bacterium]|nr:response regulator [Gammaproteobacteria bacterium]
MYRILLVDDEENILKALRRTLGRKKNWEIETYTRAEEALRRTRVMNFELVLTDYRMPVMDGVQFLSQVKQLQPEAMRLIISGYTDLEALLGAINEASIYRFISKPWSDYDLVTTLEQALSYRDTLVENRRLADRVREQRQQLDRQQTALEELEAKYPGITKVDWEPDGSFYLDENKV